MKTIILICKLIVSIDAGGIPVLIETNTEGKLLRQSSSMYLVDFSKGVKKYKLLGIPSDYRNVLIEKEKCISK